MNLSSLVLYYLVYAVTLKYQCKVFVGDFVEGFIGIEDDDICFLRWSRFYVSSCTKVVSCFSVECLTLKPASGVVSSVCLSVL